MEHNIEQFEQPGVGHNHVNSERYINEKLLNGLRNEIEEIRENEMANKKSWLARGKTGEAYNPHFDDIDPQYLNEEDLIIYKKFKEDTLSFEEMREYQNKMTGEEAGDFVNPVNKSRNNFQAYLANKLLARNFDKAS